MHASTFNNSPPEVSGFQAGYPRPKGTGRSPTPDRPSVTPPSHPGLFRSLFRLFFFLLLPLLDCGTAAGPQWYRSQTGRMAPYKTGRVRQPAVLMAPFPTGLLKQPVVLMAPFMTGLVKERCVTRECIYMSRGSAHIYVACMAWM